MKATVEETQLLPTALYPVEITAVSEPRSLKFGDCVQISFKIPGKATGLDYDYNYNNLYSLVIRPTTKLGQLVKAINGGVYPEAGVQVDTDELVGKKLGQVLSEEVGENGYVKTKILSQQPIEEVGKGEATEKSLFSSKDKKEEEKMPENI